MSKQTEIFEFDDVDLVRGLCGPNHANLALIEEAFGVYIEAVSYTHLTLPTKA